MPKVWAQGPVAHADHGVALLAKPYQQEPLPGAFWQDRRGIVGS